MHAPPALSLMLIIHINISYMHKVLVVLMFQPCGLQANAAAAEEEYAKKHAGAVAGQEGRRVWGPKPPPQHAARLYAELVLAAVGQADGRTLVAQVYPTLLYL